MGGEEENVGLQASKERGETQVVSSNLKGDENVEVATSNSYVSASSKYTRGYTVG